MKFKWHYEQRKISELNPAPYNPRRLTKDQKEQLDKSLSKFGVAEPIVINTNNTVIGGHQRLKLLKAQGITIVDVSIPDRQLTEDEEKEMNLRLNKNLGEFDFDLLANNFEAEMLQEVGFGDDELGILGDETDSISDDGDLPNDVEQRAKLGDLYRCGDHMVLCGDSTNPEHVKRLLDGAKPVLMVTDPPYGVEYDAAWREEPHKSGIRATGKVLNDDVIDWSSVYELFNADVIYVWHDANSTHVVIDGLVTHDYKIINQIIWNKNHFAIGRGDYQWKHEPCIYAVKEGAKHNWQGYRNRSTVWDIDTNTFVQSAGEEKEERYNHSTQKPIKCMAYPIVNNSRIGDSICDPFLGGGTTLIAAEQLGRIFYGMELCPEYVDIILTRWEKETGIKAVKVEPIEGPTK